MAASVSPKQEGWSPWNPKGKNWAEAPITPEGRQAEGAGATPALTATKEPVSPTAEGEPRRADHTVPCGHYMPRENRPAVGAKLLTA